jgi:hypothetical protein
MVVGFGLEMENAQWSGGLVSGRRWWTHNGVEERRWREREREGKIGGKMVWGRNQVSKSDFQFFFKYIKSKRPFPRRKRLGKGRQAVSCLSLLLPLYLLPIVSP